MPKIRQTTVLLIVLALVLGILLFVTSGCSGDPTGSDPNDQSSELLSSSSTDQIGSSELLSSSSGLSSSITIPEGVDLSIFDLNSGNGFIPESALCGDEAGVISADNGCLRYTGRVHHDKPNKNVQFNWTGIIIEAKFEGTSVAVDIDASNDVWFDAYIDDVKVETIAPPEGQTNAYNLGSLRIYSGIKRYTLATGLAEGVHTLKLSKRNETNFSVVTFEGLILDDGKKVMPLPPRAERRIEIIGDSYSAGYGVESPSKDDPTKQDATGRQCLDEEFHAYSNSALTYGSLAADLIDGEYHLNAYSGLGMVRNYNGNTAFLPFPGYYGRVLQNNAEIKYDPNGWHPEVIIIFLGTNDFSTPLNSGEVFENKEALSTAYRAAYRNFLALLRTIHPGVQFILGATNLWDEVANAPNTIMQESVKQIIAEEEATGHNDMQYILLTNTYGYACGWHPEKNRHELWGNYIANRIKAL